MDISNGNIYLSLNIFLKWSNVYYLKHQLTILGIYNYHGFSLFIARFIYKNNNNFCYIFTYSQCPISLMNPKNAKSSSHLTIVPFMNRLSYRIYIYICAVCQVIYFTTNIHVIKHFNDPKYIERIFVKWIDTQVNENCPQLYILSFEKLIMFISHFLSYCKNTVSKEIFLSIFKSWYIFVSIIEKPD